MIRKPTSTFKSHLIASIAGGLAASLLIAAASLKAQSGAQPPAPSPSKTTEQVYKNIQVLKGIPSDQLVPGHAIHHFKSRGPMRFLPHAGSI